MNNKLIPHSRPTLGQEEQNAVIEVLRSGNISQGRKVEEFENKMANYIGKKFGVAVSSGLAALHLSLIGLKIGRNDKVILPSYTCDALLQAVYYVKAKPIIVDVNYGDCNISFTDTIKAIKKEKNTKAIIIPHAFGFPAEIDKFRKLGIPIIEDCAVAIGGKYKGKKLGMFGLLSVFSFYGTKMLTTGEGGMILTNNYKLAKFLKEIRDYTKHRSFKVRFNYKLTDIQASIGLEQLKKLETFIKKRELLNKYYWTLLKEQHNIELIQYVENNVRPAYYRFIIKINKDPNEIQINLAKKGIFCGRGVLMPLHRLLKLKHNNYINTEKLFSKVLSLPIYPSLESQDIDYIIHNLILELKK